MPTLKLRRLPATTPPGAAAAAPDEVISEAVPDEIVSAAANTNNASAAVPDDVVSSSHPATAIDGGDAKRKKKRRKSGDAEKEASAKKTRVRSRAEAATSNRDGPCVGIKNPTGNKKIAKWNIRYGELMEYKQEHGDCNVPQSYEPNKPLGMWVNRQRSQYRLLQKGEKSYIAEERITKLEEIGFRWDALHLARGKVDDPLWNRRYGELIEYKQKHGHCNVPQSYKQNKQLGSWVHVQRKQHRLLQKGKYSTMTGERIAKLEAIGFVWDASYLAASNPDNDTWHQRCKELTDYKNEHGNCLVPKGYEPNKQLGRWVTRQRKQYRFLQEGKQSQMTDERITKLEEIGFVWDASCLHGGQPNNDTWNQRHKEMIEYKHKHRDCNVPQGYKANKQLGMWVSKQRQQYRFLQEGKQSAMTEERIAKLEEIGFKWKVGG